MQAITNRLNDEIKVLTQGNQHLSGVNLELQTTLKRYKDVEAQLESCRRENE